MPAQIRVTFKNFRGLDLSGGTKISVPPYKPNHFGEETILRGALNGAGGMTAHGSLLRSLLGVATPPVGTMTVAGPIPGCRIRSPIPDFTVTDAVGASAGALAAFGTSGGVYFWNKSPGGEVGLFGSLSAGMVSNVGASVGVQICLLFGKAPDVLKGDSITVSVDIGIDIATVTGCVIISAPPIGVWPPPTSWASFSGWVPEIIGIGIGASVGFSVLPMDISVMPSRTWTRPFDSAHPILF